MSSLTMSLTHHEQVYVVSDVVLSPATRPVDDPVIQALTESLGHLSK
jgi:hypothetical protein